MLLFRFIYKNSNSSPAFEERKTSQKETFSLRTGFQEDVMVRRTNSAHNDDAKMAFKALEKGVRNNSFGKLIFSTSKN